MLIGEIAKQTGLSRDTIRYYEKIGLWKRDKKARRGNYYKEYSDYDLKALFIIQLTKEYGFTLNEIKEFMTELDEKRNDAFKGLNQKVTQKIKEVDEKVNELLLFKKRLVALKKNL